MTKCSQLGFELPGFSGRKMEGNFEGGNVSGDGGLVSPQTAYLLCANHHMVQKEGYERYPAGQNS
jgi:hypothetical protein